jgi:nicotinamide-nucleotide amidase
MPYSETSGSDGDALVALVERVAALLRRERLMLVTVESCTGGGVAYAATAVPGSSDWFDRGWVTYSNSAKSDMVGVDPVLIHTHGAVSEPVARSMVRGALARCGPGRVGVALTGVAGPDGGTPEKPVGTVYIAWGVAHQERVEAQVFDGDRTQVRVQSVRRALEGIIELLESPG